MAAMTPETTLESRKTRIVCVSDTHGASPKDGAFKLPAGDVLIHAGDLTNQGSLSELKKTVDWISNAEFEVKIVVAGNHDLTLDAPFNAAHSALSAAQRQAMHEACRSLLLTSPSITYLGHAWRQIRLTSPSGPQTSFRVFGSPYSPTRGQYAFSYPPCPSGKHILSTLSTSTASSAPTDVDGQDGEALWSAIPLDTDVVVTHTPPFGIHDVSPKWGAGAGCPALRRRLWEVRPALHVCGHVHEGRGVEVVRWGMKTGRVSEICGRKEWRDSGAPSLSLAVAGGATVGAGGGAGGGDADASVTSSAMRKGGKGKKMSLVDLTGRKREGEGGLGGSAGPLENDFSDSVEPELVPTRKGRSSALGVNRYSFSNSLDVLIDGGSTRKGRLHHETVACWHGREGRVETAVVNAAIMARSHGLGKKVFNQPIVVDLDLAVWQEKSGKSTIDHADPIVVQTMPATAT